MSGLHKLFATTNTTTDPDPKLDPESQTEVFKSDIDNLESHMKRKKLSTIKCKVEKKHKKKNTNEPEEPKPGEPKKVFKSDIDNLESHMKRKKLSTIKCKVEKKHKKKNT
eukprot:8775_1